MNRDELKRDFRVRMTKESVEFVGTFAGVGMYKFPNEPVRYCYPNQPTTLRLTLKKKWFDMIASGEKKEEYREIKPFWTRRLIIPTEHIKEFVGAEYKFVWYDKVEFSNGYGKSVPKVTLEFKGTTVGKPNPEWVDDEVNDQCFIIKLGKILHKNNLDNEPLNQRK